MMTHECVSESVTYVTVDGPYPDEGPCGDERPVWYVGLMDKDDEPVEVFPSFSLAVAISSAELLAGNGRLNVVCDATPV